VQQLFVSPELKIIISLSDGIISVHDLASYQLVLCMHRTKGATLFSADLEVRAGCCLHQKVEAVEIQTKMS